MDLTQIIQLEKTLYCKEYAQILPPEYHLYAWVLWFVGILTFGLLWYMIIMQIKND